MKIGVIGSGQVGRALSEGFAARGHDVTIGSRTPAKPELQKWRKGIKGTVSTATFEAAAARGEIVLLCVPGDAAEAAIALAGERNFDGKVVIDVMNPLDFSAGDAPGLFVGLTDSLGERIQRRLPKARVVKCFNIVNNQTMIHPQMKEGLPDMMIAGDDAAAKRQVTTILKEFGWGEPIDIGGIDGARWLEAIVPLWVRLAMRLGTWGIAWKVLRA